jgi:hypothetical protein
VDLVERIAARRGGFLLFALTPPRASTPPQDAQAVADVTVERLRPLGLDGLILYDLADESGRTGQPRPFPFLPTLDPTDYLDRHLTTWHAPVIVYRATAKYREDQVRDWVADQDPRSRLAVFVGASTSEAHDGIALRRAQQIRAETSPGLLLGAVAIPERHRRRGDEHLRMIEKQSVGCSFFVTQIVYDLDAAKNLVSDYAYECRTRRIDPVPLVFTSSVCGSMRTVEFLRWLGVDVPRWVENDLRHARDILDASVDHAEAILADLMSFCDGLGVPYGISIESVSIRRAEIEASVGLAARMHGRLTR